MRRNRELVAAVAESTEERDHAVADRAEQLGSVVAHRRDVDRFRLDVHREEAVLQHEIAVRALTGVVVGGGEPLSTGASPETDFESSPIVLGVRPQARDEVTVINPLGAARQVGAEVQQCAVSRRPAIQEQREHHGQTSPIARVDHRLDYLPWKEPGKRVDGGNCLDRGPERLAVPQEHPARAPVAVADQRAHAGLQPVVACAHDPSASSRWRRRSGVVVRNAFVLQTIGHTT